MDPPGRPSAQQLVAASHQQSVRKLASARVPVFGLPVSWQGRRSLGYTCFESGIERARDGTTTASVHETVELIHELHGGLSHLSVESGTHFGEITKDALRTLLEEFDTHRERDAVLRGTHRRAPRRGAGVDDGQLTIVLDGRPNAFAAVRSGRLVVARWPGHGITVTIKAEAWSTIDTVMLDRVTDFGPYLDDARPRATPVRVPGSVR